MIDSGAFKSDGYPSVSLLQHEDLYISVAQDPTHMIPLPHAACDPL